MFWHPRVIPTSSCVMPGPHCAFCHPLIQFLLSSPALVSHYSSAFHSSGHGLRLQPFSSSGIPLPSRDIAGVLLPFSPCSTFSCLRAVGAALGDAPALDLGLCWETSTEHGGCRNQHGSLAPM